MPRNEKREKRYLPRDMKILYEDKDLIAIVKPEKLNCISVPGKKARTAYSIITSYVRRGNPKARERVFIVHRLDRDTTGVLLFAKNYPAKEFLQENWKKFEKTYIAVTDGIPENDEGTIRNYIAENKVLKMYVTSNPSLGKEAITKYKVIKKSGNRALLSIRLVTGRKNQIRVHFAHMGFPILGDEKYGEKEGPHLYLHSESLEFIHPVTKKRIRLEAPVPAFFDEAMRDRPAKPERRPRRP
jgi:23S rRNA pseudouridine1911/1915/1917 synthase